MPAGIYEHKRKETGDRFWPKVNRTEGCWVWTGGKNRQGYGLFRFRNRSFLAHRASWILHHGEIPTALGVLHKCDTPLCVNPSHLFLGTQQDNMDDAKSKGRVQIGDANSMRRHPERIARGERRWNARLTENQVREIRQAAKVITHKEIARRFGLDPCQVSRIVSGKRWKHVT